MSRSNCILMVVGSCLVWNSVASAQVGFGGVMTDAIRSQRDRLRAQVSALRTQAVEDTNRLEVSRIELKNKKEAVLAFRSNLKSLLRNEVDRFDLFRDHLEPTRKALELQLADVDELERSMSKFATQAAVSIDAAEAAQQVAMILARTTISAETLMRAISRSRERNLSPHYRDLLDSNYTPASSIKAIELAIRDFLSGLNHQSLREYTNQVEIIQSSLRLQLHNIGDLGDAAGRLRAKYALIGIAIHD